MVPNLVIDGQTDEPAVQQVLEHRLHQLALAAHREEDEHEYGINSDPLANYIYAREKFNRLLEAPASRFEAFDTMAVAARRQAG